MPQGRRRSACKARGSTSPKIHPCGCSCHGSQTAGCSSRRWVPGGPLPRSVRPHNPPSADARPPRGVLRLFVCPLPWLPAAESLRILPAWEAPGLVFSTGAPRLSGWGEMSTWGRGTSWGPGLPGSAGSIRGCWGAGMLGGSADGAAQRRAHEGGSGSAPSAAPSLLRHPLPHTGVPPAPSLPGVGPFGEVSVDAGEMRQSLGNGGGQSPSLRHFAPPALRQPRCGEGRRGEVPGSVPTLLPKPQEGKSRSCGASPSPGPLHPRGDLGAQNEARAPALRLRAAPRCRQHTQGTSPGDPAPSGWDVGTAPPAPGQGGEGVGHQQTSCRRHCQPFLSPRRTDGRTDGRGTGSIPHASRCQRCSPCSDCSPAPPAPPPSPAPRPPSAVQAPASGRDQPRCGERGGL